MDSAPRTEIKEYNNVWLTWHKTWWDGKSVEGKGWSAFQINRCNELGNYCCQVGLDPIDFMAW